MIEIVRKLGDSKNAITTIAIGGEYYDEWEKYAKPSWLLYCEKHDLGLLVVKGDLIEKSDKFWKKPTWQKLLIGRSIKNRGINASNICYLDTDIIINPFAPNIFNEHNEESISLVSLRSNLPFSYHKTLKKIAFYRNKKLSSDYPLDSALFISLEDLYQYHDLPPQKDEACMGLIVFNVNNFYEIMESWFYKYDKEVFSITNGGDQTHLNYEIQKYGKVKWLDYKFQALWVFEMSNYYPFLYNKKCNSSLKADCINTSIFQNYFLHFPGLWIEGGMWKDSKILNNDIFNEYKELFRYYDVIPTGVPRGMIKP
jgi:hypothetical protein